MSWEGVNAIWPNNGYRSSTPFSSTSITAPSVLRAMDRKSRTVLTVSAVDKKYDNYLKKVINKSDHFFYISETIKEDLIKLKIPQNKMTHFPNSVELNKFQNEKLKINTNDKKNFIIDRGSYLSLISKFKRYA